MPKLSIIIPTFNAVKTIEETLRSIVDQSFQDFELIVFDNHSNDGTLDLLQKEKRIDHLIIDHDLGIYDAMNKATATAKGDWCYYIGSDDVLFNSRSLEKVFENIDDKTDFIYGNVLLKNKQLIYDGLFDKQKLSLKNICHQAIFVRRKVLLEKGLFNLKYKSYADWYLNILCFGDPSVNIKYLPETVAVYNESGFSSGYYDLPFHQDKPQLIANHFKIKLPIYQRIAYKYEYALVLKKRGEKAQSFKYLLASLLFIPNRFQKIKKYVRF